MSNSEMKTNRFSRWAECRALYRAIVEKLTSGGGVQVTTYTHSWVYTFKHLALISCGKTGVYVRQGKQKNDISRCGIRFSK